MLDLDHIDADAIVNSTDSRFSGSNEVDGEIFERAGMNLRLKCKMSGKLKTGHVKVTDGYSLPVKSIVHVAVPEYGPEKETMLEDCYYKCLEAVSGGKTRCSSIVIPVLGAGSCGWPTRVSMRCAWRAVLHYGENYGGADFGAPDKLRKIVLAYDVGDIIYPRDCREHVSRIFFNVPEKWTSPGNRSFWWYLMKCFVGDAAGYPEPAALMRTIDNTYFEMTGQGLGTPMESSPGETMDKQIDRDALLTREIPLLFDNYCHLYYGNGMEMGDTAEIESGGYEWTIPRECVKYLEALPVPVPVSAKISLREVGLKYSPMVKKALKICFEAHKDQKDLGGLPYVFHPFHLAEQMETEAEICTALLHDVVEDTDYTLEDLKAEGFTEEILAAVELLTHDSSVPYMEYIYGLRGNRLARKVKMADLKHNSDTDRMEHMSEIDKKRLEKYRTAEAILKECE